MGISLATSDQTKGIKPFTHRNHHELYNSGHLFTSACIHYRLTGKTELLEIAKKNADYLYRKFQPRPKELARFGFNQSQIMGLTELYRTTKDKRYLDLAETFISMRGASRVEPDSTVSHTSIGDMVQERTPLRQETEAFGHAVLALYFYAGAADVAAETGEKALVDALDRLWENVVHKKMYVTGAVGQTHHGASSQSDKSSDFVHEAFIDEYMMPNLTAYNETCANIANAMFSWRMMGYTMRTDRYRLVVWKDSAHSNAQPVFVELYDHQTDPAETVNIVDRRPGPAATLLGRFDTGWKVNLPEATD